MHIITFEPHTFNPDTIMNSGQVFRFTKENDKYICLSGNHILEFTSNSANTEITCDTDDIEFFKEYFDTRTDYATYNEKILRGNDVFLKDALNFSDGMRILKQDLWETIISYMISQNNNIPKIKKSINILIDRYSSNSNLASNRAFPSPEELAAPTVDELSTGTMLGYRAAYISEFSKNVADGKIDLAQLSTLDYQDSYSYLLSQKGIGPKVCSCICLYGLHHMEGYPIDTWMKKIISEDYSTFTQPDYMDYINSTYPGFQGYIQQLQFYYKRR